MRLQLFALGGQSDVHKRSIVQQRGTYRYEVWLVIVPAQTKLLPGHNFLDRFSNRISSFSTLLHNYFQIFPRLFLQNHYEFFLFSTDKNILSIFLFWRSDEETLKKLLWRHPENNLYKFFHTRSAQKSWNCFCKYFSKYFQNEFRISRIGKTICSQIPKKIQIKPRTTSTRIE